MSSSPEPVGESQLAARESDEDLRISLSPSECEARLVGPYLASLGPEIQRQDEAVDAVLRERLGFTLSANITVYDSEGNPVEGASAADAPMNTGLPDASGQPMREDGYLASEVPHAVAINSRPIGTVGRYLLGNRLRLDQLVTLLNMEAHPTDRGLLLLAIIKRSFARRKESEWRGVCERCGFQFLLESPDLRFFLRRSRRNPVFVGNYMLEVTEIHHLAILLREDGFGERAAEVFSWCSALTAV